MNTIAVLLIGNFSFNQIKENIILAVISKGIFRGMWMNTIDLIYVYVFLLSFPPSLSCYPTILHYILDCRMKCAWSLNFVELTMLKKEFCLCFYWFSQNFSTQAALTIMFLICLILIRAQGTISAIVFF